MVYYDVTKPITLEVDASQKGLGAALVQEKKTNCIRVKNPHKDAVKLQQHRKRDAVSRPRSGEVPHIPIREGLHNHNRPQTLGDDLQQTNRICSASPAEDASQDPGL